MEKISKIKTNEKESFFLLAETAFSHQGDLQYLNEQIQAAQSGKADGIKFQMLLSKDDAYSPNYSVYKLFDQWMLDENQWKEIIQSVHEKTDLEVTVLPIDMSALQFCLENSRLIDSLEIHSINMNQTPFLRKISNFDNTIILGVGGRTLDDINYCLDIINSAKVNRNIVMMHGFQSFPTNYQEIKLSRIRKLGCLYNSIMGYADHTAFDDNFSQSLINYAYLNGARVFEKHLVLRKGEKRIDYESAVDSEYFVKLRKSLNNLIQIQGEDCALKFTENEIKYKNREKQIIAIEDIHAGDVFSTQNIGYKVDAVLSDFEQKDYEKVLGKKAAQSISKNSVLKYHHIKQ